MSAQEATAPRLAESSTAADHLAAAVVALVLGAALALAARISTPALVLGVAVLQALLVAAWVLGTGLPGRIGGLVLGVLAAAAADIVIVQWPGGQLSPLLAVVGLTLPAMFVHQLTRGVVRLRVTESLSDIALLVICVVALPAFVQLRHETGGEVMATTVVAAAAAALVVGHLVDARWPLLRFDAAVPRGLVAVVAGTVVGGAVGYLRLHGTVEFSSGRSLFLGAAVGAVVGLLAVGAAFLPREVAIGWLRPVYVVLIPLALVALIGYLLCLAVRAWIPLMRRRWKILLGVVLVLVVLLVVADRVGVGVAENAARSRLAQDAQFIGHPSVDVHGIPFLTQAARGHYDDIEVSGDLGPLGQITGAMLDVNLRGAEIPFGDLVGRHVQQVPVERVDGTVTIPYAELARLTKIPDLTITANGSRLDATATATLPAVGRQVVTGEGQVTLEAGQLKVTIISLRVGSVPIPSAVLPAVSAALTSVIPVPQLPYGLRLVSATPRPDGLQVAGQGRDVVLGRVS